MVKLQYDSFYKFIVSLGLVLVVFPMVVFYFIFKETGEFLISEMEFRELSAFSLRFLENRDILWQYFFSFFPVLCLISMGIGLLLFFYGLLHWKKIQKEYDAQICMKTKKDQKELEKMSPIEIVTEKIGETESVSTQKNDCRAKLIKTMQIENLFFEYLKKSLSSSYQIEQHVKWKGNHYDMVAISFEKEILYEVRYWRQYPDVGKFTCCYNGFKERYEIYKKNIFKKVEARLVIVCPISELEKMKLRCTSFLEKRIITDEDFEILYFAEEDLQNNFVENLIRMDR